MKRKGGDGSERGQTMKTEITSDTHNTDTHKADTDPLKEDTDPPTSKGLSKSARNRFYAQASRARHQMYVANLEKDRQMLLERLEKIEEENRRLRMDIMEMKMTKRRRTEDAFNIHKDLDLFNYSSKSTTLSPMDSSNNYALSVLDFIAFPPTKTNISGKPVASIDSPWPSKFDFKAPQFFLLDDDANGRRGCEMNWKDNCWGILKPPSLLVKMKGMSTLERMRMRMRMLRLVKLAKLNIYLQQSGNN